MASEAQAEDGRPRTVCCRLCLSVDSSKSSIIIDAIGDELLIEKIYAFVNVKIRAADKYSTMICTPCVDKINIWYAYKQTCLHNQTKLEKGLHDSEASEQIVEPMNSSDSHSVAANDGIPASVKSERIDVEYEKLPPPSTPRDQQKQGTEAVKNKFAESDQNNAASNPQDAASSRTLRDGIIARPEVSSMTEELRRECSEEKRAFLTENLKLVARNSTPVELQESLTKIEKSYIEKCTAMDKMYRTLRCACHHASHPKLKSLFTHLRNTPLGFPSFTCYNCMITFPDRSSKTRHSHSKCPNSKLEALMKLSNLRQRSKIKTRIYQNYKCRECGHLFSFHEDFCAHVDEYHCQSLAQPLRCSCDRVFTSFEDYKSHAYMSCLIEYYCDICFISVKTLDDFQKHAAECHDASEGFPIFMADNYRQRGPRSKSAPSSRANKKTYSKEATSLDNIVQGKRVRRASVYQQLREVEGYAENKGVNETSPPTSFFQSTPKTRVSTRKRKTTETLVVSENTVFNPASIQKDASHICTVCGKKYSSGANLLRHLQTHRANREAGHQNETHSSGFVVGSHETNGDSKKSMKRKQYPKEESDKEMLQLYPEEEPQKNVPLLIFKKEVVIVMCDICDTMFVTQEELKEHKLIHETMPVLEPSIDIDKKVPKVVKHFDCNFCDKSYLSSGSFWKHTRKFHPGLEPTTYCELCQKEFHKTRAYNRHKVVHQNNDDSVNSIVQPVRQQDQALSAGDSGPKQKVIPMRDTVPNLIQNETDVKAPCIYTCDVCVGIFSSKADLVKHKKKHIQEQMLANQKRNNCVYCKFCKMSFLNSDELDNHVKQKHVQVFHQSDASNLRYFCKHCPKVYPNRFALSAHGKSHINSVEVNKSRTSKTKKVKLDAAKLATPSFKCGQCQAIMPNDIAMQIHILEKHGNVDASALPARCCTCSLDFPNQDEYEQHKRLHTMYQKSCDRTNFTCKECSAVFTRSDDLDIHRRQFHNSEDQNVREYKCALCHRVFDKQNYLDIHLMVHQSQKLKVPKPKQSFATCL